MIEIGGYVPTKMTLPKLCPTCCNEVRVTAPYDGGLRLTCTSGHTWFVETVQGTTGHYIDFGVDPKVNALLGSSYPTMDTTPPINKTCVSSPSGVENTIGEE